MPRSTFLINKSHYAGGSRFVLPLPSAFSVDSNSKTTISVLSFSMYNSTYNISNNLGNNTIKFTWIDNTVYNWTIEDGYYSVDDLNTWLQSKFIEYKLYCTSQDKSTNIYFVQFLTNPTGYKNEIDVFYVPSYIDVGTTGIIRASGAGWSFPDERKLPKIEINPGLKSYFGMSSRVIFGNETDQTKLYQYLSDITPTISPVFVYVVLCNLINNDFSLVPTLLSQYPIKVGFGSLIIYEASFDTQISVKPGVYFNIIIDLQDQNGAPLQFRDPDFSMTILVDY